MPRAIRATCRFTPPRGGEPVPVEAVFAEFCDRGYEPGQRYSAAGEPVWAQPHDGSAPLTNNVRGKVVLLARSKAAVHIITQCKHAATAGAVAVILVHTGDALEPVPDFFTNNTNEHVQIP
ncbi:hypothetical protein T484DRAFT_1893609 [Baffinella frigidus]|nr:hypothetical protein T484DRAFT_1893609 [Cryptophyta sp. CCMP2293]